jgi:hypothetical protein
METTKRYAVTAHDTTGFPTSRVATYKTLEAARVAAFKLAGRLIGDASAVEVHISEGMSERRHTVEVVKVEAL